MNLLNWVLGRNSKVGEASGDRVNESITNHERLLAGLPPQKKAWFIDLDGKKHYHDLDVHNGVPNHEVSITLYKVSGDKEKKTYEYDKEAEGYLIYYQV